MFVWKFKLYKIYENHVRWLANSERSARRGRRKACARNKVATRVSSMDMSSFPKGLHPDSDQITPGPPGGSPQGGPSKGSPRETPGGSPRGFLDPGPHGVQNGRFRPSRALCFTLGEPDTYPLPRERRGRVQNASRSPPRVWKDQLSVAGSVLQLRYNAYREARIT